MMLFSTSVEICEYPDEKIFANPLLPQRAGVLRARSETDRAITAYLPQPLESESEIFVPCPDGTAEYAPHSGRETGDYSVKL